MNDYHHYYEKNYSGKDNKFLRKLIEHKSNLPLSLLSWPTRFAMEEFTHLHAATALIPWRLYLIKGEELSKISISEIFNGIRVIHWNYWENGVK